MRMTRADADVYLPGGGEPERHLARTTHLGIGAHPDDVEPMALSGIAACLSSQSLHFTAVVCTDGRGSPRAGRYAGMTDEEMVATRAAEQRRAAEVGRYNAAVQLMHPSATVRDPASALLADDLVAVLRSAGPGCVYTHAPTDRHETHVAVAMATISACRQLAPADRPARVYGCEGWRGLGWLGERERLDCTGAAGLSDDLMACFDSQIAGGKRYDLAARGRRRANATFDDPYEVDEAEEVVLAMDLGPLVDDDELDVREYIVGRVDRFRDDVDRTLAPYLIHRSPG